LTPALSIRLEAPGPPPRTHTLVRGEDAAFESLVGSAAGSILVICSPSFQPSLCGLGEDTRSLTCQLRLAEIVDGDGRREALMSVDYGA
jgi:hypothetical protein